MTVFGRKLCPASSFVQHKIADSSVNIELLRYAIRVVTYESLQWQTRDVHEAPGGAWRGFSPRILDSSYAHLTDFENFLYDMR